LIEEQKPAFKQMMGLLMQAANKPKPDAELLRLWWAKLEKYEIEDVCRAFDTWIDTKTYAATPADIIELCRHRVTIHPRLPSPLNIASNRQHAAEVKQQLDKFGKPKREMKDWARRILADQNGMPDIAVRFANEALHQIVEEAA
jgi:hypothetical protein